MATQQPLYLKYATPATVAPRTARAAGVNALPSSSTASYRGSPFAEEMSSVERQIRATAAAEGAGDIADLLVAIATKESGLKPDNPGDYDAKGVSRSDGVFQENDGGRGHGLTVEQKRNVPGSTRRAIAEIRATQKANPGADLGTIAIKAQRPREDLQPGYRAEINKMLAGNTRVNGLGPAGQAVQQGVNKAFNGKYSLPVDGKLTNPWGGEQTYAPGKKTDIGTFNHGADLAVPAGTVVRAPVGGVVKSVYNTKLDDRKGERDGEENSGWGGQVTILGDDGKLHRLDHAQFGSIQVQPGQRVEQGQPTHKVGVSGNSTGPHVDWEKWTVDAKGNPVKSEDPLAAPTVSAKAATEAYTAAFAAAQAQRSAGTSGSGTGGTGETGDTAVSQTAQASRDVPSDLETYYTQEVPRRTDAVTAAKNAVTLIDAQLNSWKQQQKDTLARKDVNGNVKSAERVDPEFAARRDAIAKIEGVPGTTDKGTRAAALTKIEEAEKELDDAKKGLSAESTRRKGSGATADSIAKDQADLEYARLKVDEFKAKIATGGLSPAEYADTMSQIQTREAELRLREQALTLDRQRVGNETRTATSNIERQGVQNITDMAKLPYDIEGMIASADLTTEQANALRTELPYIIKKHELELKKGYALLPSDIAQGVANADLTRAQADQYRALMGPTIQEFADKHHLSEVSTTRLLQLLPHEVAKAQADVKLTLAQTGLTGAQAELAQTEVALAKEAAAGRKRVEDWIRANPNATDEDIDAVVVREATSLQDRIAARGLQLKAKADKEANELGIKQRQIEQQRADTEQASASERGIADFMTAGATQANAFTNAVVAPVGPARRMAQALAMAPMIGEKGLEGALTGMNFGQPEYEAARELAKNYGSRISTIQSRAGDGIRRAPTVMSAAIEAVKPPAKFNPPTSSPQAVAGPQATGLPNPKTTEVTVDLNKAPTESQAPTLGANDHPDEQAAVAGVTGGPAAGTMYPDEANASALDVAPVGAEDETEEERRQRMFYNLPLNGASVSPGLAGAGLGLGGGGVPQAWWPGGGGGRSHGSPSLPQILTRGSLPSYGSAALGRGSPSLAQMPQLDPFTSLPPAMSPMNQMNPMAQMNPMHPMNQMKPMAKMALAPGAQQKLLPDMLAANFGQFAPRPGSTGGGGDAPENALTGGDQYATAGDLDALQQAVQQADPDEVRRQAALAFAAGKIGKRDFDQLCEQFAENAYGTGFGTPTQGQFPSAKAAAEGLGATPGDPAAVKGGDLVFFKPDKSNNQFGHVGLADPDKGPGSFISATASGVRNDNYLNDPYWKSLYSGTAAPPSSWAGRTDSAGGGGGPSTIGGVPWWDMAHPQKPAGGGGADQMTMPPGWPYKTGAPATGGGGLGMSGGAPTRWWLLNGKGE